MSQSSSEPPLPSIWKTVVDSLKGQHFDYDYTSGSLNRAVLLLAIPMVLEMIMESLFVISDVFWVSRLGKEAVAVVGITESLMTLIYAVAIGISIAATAIVARRIGEKEPKKAAQAAGQILILGVLVSAVIGMIMGVYAPDILAFMGADRSVIEIGSSFARIMFGGNATVFLIFVINAIFRGAGDAVIAMRTLWLANALNIVLGPCFIFGLGPFPEIGVTGAAVATNIGRGVGVLYQLWHLFGNRRRIGVSLEHLRPNLDIMGTVLKTSGSGIFQLLLSTTSWVGLFKIIALFGNSALAGYTIAVRIISFALMPAWGLANAGATLVGQNLGSGQPDRAQAAVKVATKYNVLILGIVGLLYVIFSSFLIALFADDPEVVGYASTSLWILSLALPLYGAGMCLEAAFNGAGDMWTPARLNFYCLWLGQIPVAWLLAKLGGFGAVGVFIAVPLSFSAMTIWAARLFKVGKWKLKRI